MKICIVVAAHNEEETIAGVIDDLHNHNYHNIVVVDDHSTDKTEMIARTKGALVIHPINRGQGSALKFGNNFALINNFGIIVHFDGDGQMQAKDIKDMIDPIVYNEAEITIGSRFMGKEPENMPRSKKIILYLGKLWLRMYGVRLTDSQCGFRAMSNLAAHNIRITHDGMEHASEILIETFSKKIPHKEIPVSIKYTAYSQAHSHHGNFQFFKVIKLAFNVMWGRVFK